MHKISGDNPRLCACLLSLPAGGRGLKFTWVIITNARVWSSPAWGRGLKFDVRTFGAVMTVAPPRVGGVYGYKLSVTGERQAILVNPELYRRDTGLALSDEGGYGLFS